MNRCGFLRDLAALPFIGGSVALIGRPVRTAHLATPEQVIQYAAFAAWEMRHALAAYDATGRNYFGDLADATSRHQADFPGVETIPLRVPVILSAAGVPLAGGRTHG